MRWKYALVVALVLALAGGVVAAEVMQATVCNVDADTVVEGNLLVICRELHVDGRVNGSIFGLALTANITGEVTGDVYLVSRNLEVTGSLGDDLHFVGGLLDVKSGTAWEAGSLVAVAVGVHLEPETTVPDDVSAIAYQLQVSGNVGGDILFAGESLTLDGQTGRDVYARTGDTLSESSPQLLLTLLSLGLGLQAEPAGLRLTEDAVIGRHLDYSAPSMALLDGEVVGDVSHTPVTDAPTIEEMVAEESRSNALRQYFGQVVQDTLVMTLMGSLLLLLAPSFVKRPARAVGDKIHINALLGLTTFVLSFPVLGILLAVSVLILALLALLRIEMLTVATAVSLGLLNLGGGSLFYFISGYIARMIVAAALGTLILERVSAKELTVRDWMLGVAVGAGLIALATSLPTVGWVINLAVIGLGLGAILRLLWKMTRPQVITSPGPMRVVLTPPAVMALPPQLPPPLVDDTPPARGMENLPAGFRWWDDE
jgi:hypothetical protein